MLCCVYIQIERKIIQPYLMSFSMISGTLNRMKLLFGVTRFDKVSAQLKSGQKTVFGVLSTVFNTCSLQVAVTFRAIRGDFVCV